MTAQPPATKASGVSALLASLSPSAPAPLPPIKQDFLSMILGALTTGVTGADPATAAQPSHAKPSSPTPGAADAAASEATAASLLLALLVPPLPLPPPLFMLAKLSAQKSSVPSVLSASPASQSTPETRAAKTAASDARIALSRQFPDRDTAPETSGSEQHADSAKNPGSPVGEKPLTSTVQPSPAETALEKKPVEPVAEKPLLPPGQVSPGSGTSVATSNQLMNNSTQRNEIAGRTEQKLPPADVSAVGGANTGGATPDGGAKSSLSFSWSEPAPEQVAIIALAAKTAGEAAPAMEAAPAGVPVSASLDRLEQMISREAINVRQTSAQTLGVSLKLDSNTELFLQLTTQNGLVQASVRCDRGQFAPEDAQWAQLQQSLARQNVELLPMTGSSNLNFQQPSDKHPHPPAAREEWPAPGAPAQPAQPRKQKQQNRPPKNWESWA
jgi:hypothetical protein